MVPAPPVSEKLDMNIKRGLPGSWGIMLLRVSQKAEPERRSCVSAGSLFGKVLPRGSGAGGHPEKVFGLVTAVGDGGSIPLGPSEEPTE